VATPNVRHGHNEERKTKNEKGTVGAPEFWARFFFLVLDAGEGAEQFQLIMCGGTGL